MNIKTLIVSLVFSLIAFPVFSQNRESDILSSLISEHNTAATDPLQYISDYSKSSVSPLDFITTSVSESPLDFVRETTKSSLDIVTATTFSPTDGISVLNSISSAFNGTGFYTGGVAPLLPTASVTSRPTTFAKASGTGQYIPGYGRISSGFGYRMWDKKMHNGVDISMSVGDTVRVVLPGVVERISTEPGGYGNYVIVRHSGGMETRYAHLSSTLVTLGQTVAANQPIALSGNTGRSTGPHLHFEARFNGTPVDPMTVLNGRTLQTEMPRSFTPEYHDGRPGSNLAKKSGNTGRRTYIVKVGDTLSKIAERHGISVTRLCQLNFILDNQTPEPGSMLIVK